MGWFLPIFRVTWRKSNLIMIPAYLSYIRCLSTCFILKNLLFNHLSWDNKLKNIKDFIYLFICVYYYLVYIVLCGLWMSYLSLSCINSPSYLFLFSRYRHWLRIWFSSLLEVISCLLGESLLFEGIFWIQIFYGLPSLVL